MNAKPSEHPNKRLQAAPIQGTLAIYWGAWGGFGVICRDGWLRVGVGRVALLYCPMDLDIILEWASEHDTAPNNKETP